MKKLLLAGLASLSLAAPAAFAQQGYYPCQGYGCGMMMGPGMMGPGMMGGYGMGPGMMGPGMMGGYGYGGPHSGGPDLTKEQAEKIDRIRDDLAKKEAPLMQQIFEEKRKLQDMYSSGANPSALDQAYRKTTDLERQVFNARADAQKRMNAVLTKEQREKMKGMQRGYDQGSGPGMWRGYDHDMMMGPGMWDWD
ncbi:MAG: Spy/CpxP family protein refolding chaperone [Thiobacillaceae bacterium]